MIKPGFKTVEWPIVVGDPYLWMYNYPGTNIVAYDTRDYHPDDVPTSVVIPQVVAVFKRKK